MLNVSVQLPGNRGGLGSASLLSFLVGVLLSSIAEAQPRLLTLRYDNPAGCADANAFGVRLGQRISQLKVQLEEKAPALQVTIDRDGTGYPVSVTLIQAGTDVLRRKLVAQSCAEALDAASFVVAVALNEAAEKEAADTGGVREESVAAASTARSTASNPASTSAATGKPQSQEKHGSKLDSKLDSKAFRAAEGPSPTGNPDSQLTTEAAMSFRASVAVGAEVQWGAAPRPLLGPWLQGGIKSTRPGIWSPALWIHVGYAWSESVQGSAGIADFQLASGGIELCPSFVQIGSLGIRLCAVSRAGWLRASGSHTVNPVVALRPWFELGGKLSLSLLVSDSLSLFVQGKLTAPLLRDRFQFDSLVFHRPAAVVGGANVGLALRFN